MEGEDYRHRRFETDPGRGYFVDRDLLRERAAAAGTRALHTGFDDLLSALARVHPIRFAGLVDHVEALFLEGVGGIERLTDALRWVHFVDTLYDSAVPLRASSEVPLGGLFPGEFVSGPYGKKLSRCLSRMEEMLGEDAGTAEQREGPGS